jgi:poly(hydroxyalkanoate) depolymerase family esterase
MIERIIRGLRAAWEFGRKWLFRRPRGRWISGATRDPDGRLMYAPWARPSRDYQLFAPRRREGAAPQPLVVMLHGCKQRPRVFAAGTRMNRLAAREGFLVLYPAQGWSANPLRCWNWFDPAVLRGQGEAAIVVAMIREIASQHAIDPQRIYVAGMSSGGALATVLANRYGALFAACASHSGIMFRGAASVWSASHAMTDGSAASPENTITGVSRPGRARRDFVPTLVIQGDADDTVHPANAEQIEAQSLAAYSQAFPDNDTVTTRASEQSSAGRRYVVQEHVVRGRVIVCRIVVEGLGHAWSGGDARYPFNDAVGPDATSMIWRFLSAHRRETLPEHAEP